jgi:hypothetical protein
MLNVVTISMMMFSAGAQPQPAPGSGLFDCLFTEARERAQSDLSARAAAEAVADACRARIDAQLAAASASPSGDPAVAERERNTTQGLRREIAARLPAMALSAVEKERARR